MFHSRNLTVWLFIIFSTLLQDSISLSMEVKYALDSSMGQNLALIEQHLYKSLSQEKDRFQESSTCYQQVSKYLQDFESDQEAIDEGHGAKKAKALVQNPLLIFRQIRRIYQTLYHDVAQGCEGKAKVKQNTEKLFETFGLPFITEEDLVDALKGVLRIHYVYGFNATEDLRKGYFYDVDTGVTLSFEDCLTLAKAALKYWNARILAYQWILAAEEVQKESKIKSKEESAELANVWEELLKAAKLKDRIEVQKKFHGKVESRLEFVENYHDHVFYTTCRGQGRLSVEEASKLFCYYERTFHHYLVINPLKIEHLSFEPIIVQIYDFVDENANNFMVEYLEDHMTPAKMFVKGSPEAKVAPQRAGFSAEIPRNAVGIQALEGLFRKVEYFSGMVAKKETASSLEAAVYNSLGHYGFHYDTFKQNNVEIGKSGDRIATFLYYLTDVEMGGFTAFSHAGIWATPIRNSAVFWYNYKDDKIADPTTLYSECPVILGTKIATNHWIHQNENMEH